MLHFGQCSPGGRFRVGGVLACGGLGAYIFFVIEVFFVVELEGMLDIFDGRSGA